MYNETNWIAIVNPNAGLGKGKRDWNKISAVLRKKNIVFENVFTEQRGHAIELCKDYISKGRRNFIVVGGDGTLNEVVNGIMLQDSCPPADIKLSMIPVGTGNDWGRMYGIPTDYQKAVEIIAIGNSILQDAGLVRYYSHETPIHRYFINMAGMGFDALVAKKMNKQKEKGKGNPLGYFLNIFTSLFYHQSIASTFTIDGKEFKARVYSANAGICKYNGGGMKQAPNAIPDDGLLDITIITAISKIKIILNAKKLFDGSYVELPEVESFRAENIHIETEIPMYLETDGESLGHGPFEFSVIPSALQVMVPGKI